MRKTAIAVLITGLLSACIAQKPNVTNAKLQELSAAGGLKAVFDAVVQKQEAPAWIGYRIPATPKERTMCCFDSWDGFRNSGNGCCAGCKLESGKGGSFNGTVSDCSPPEPFHYSFVLFRVEGKEVTKVRNYTPDCALDFGGLPLYWMEDVNPAQSVELLVGLLPSKPDAEAGQKKNVANGVIAAIALHDDPAADSALEKLIQPDKPDSVREHVVFWLGMERGQKGLTVLRRYAKEDPNDRLREKITFAFSQSKEPEAIQDLISMARNDPSSRVRSQAIFWMGQIGGRKEAEQITAAIENDPETDVKKRAVFALAQMKNGEGVPLLITVAKSNKNPVVRKEAIRWLGMTGDPRALDFLEQILTK
ncbi:MAG TPA: HEAT repeat domain-containing protein [Candidatus Angelobacter sp.]